MAVCLRDFTAEAKHIRGLKADACLSAIIFVFSSPSSGHLFY
jgi:hypothetical protein